jgi:lipoprotein Spr
LDLKKIALLLLLLILVASCKSTSSATKSSKSKKSDKLTEQIIDSAEDNLGSPYKSGGTSKSGFDCSGLVYSTFKNYSIVLPRRSIDMSNSGKLIDVKDAEKGDLIFFKTNGSKQINHVGLIIEIDGNYIKFIHSSTSKGVIISSTKEEYYKKAFAQVNRILE